MMIRLDKFLSDAGAGTRSQVKDLIRKGNVTVNGQAVRKPEFKLDPERDQVEAAGKPISANYPVYYLLHKPAGYVCAARDNLFPTVMELVPGQRDLFPVGRLDKDTEGLLLITNDGALAHLLLSPRRHVDKTYFAVLTAPATEDDVRLFRQGVEIGDDKPTLPAFLEPLPDCRARLTIHEGRFHQVKRMFHAVGKEVVYLKRLSMGPLRLPDDLEKGCFRELTAAETEALREAVRSR